jgi:hypothetical protein
MAAAAAIIDVIAGARIIIAAVPAIIAGCIAVSAIAIIVIVVIAATAIAQRKAAIAITVGAPSDAKTGGGKDKQTGHTHWSLSR